MNKVLFNSGGQPVYLDDLKVIQDLAGEGLIGVLQAIINSAKSPYVEDWTSGDILGTLIPMGAISSTNTKGFFVSPHCSCNKNDANRKVTLNFINGGYVCIGGELLQYEPTEVEVSYNAPFYVIVKKEDIEVRTLASGEQAACKEHKYAIISSHPDYIGESFSSDQLCCLTDAIYQIVKAKTYADGDKWTKLDVEFFNGYTGTVAYRELPDSYRYRINISSNNTNFDDFCILFKCNPTEFKGSYRGLVSCLFATGGAEGMAYPCYIRFGVPSPFGDGTYAVLQLVKELDENSQRYWRPGYCPVNIVFEIAK